MILSEAINRIIRRKIIINNNRHIESFIEKNQWEAIDYYNSMYEKTALLQLSYDLLLKGKQDGEKKIVNLVEKKNEEMARDGRTYLMKDDVQNTKPSIMDITVEPLFFFKKFVGELIHYSMMICDMYLQLINSCVLQNSINHEKVKLRSVMDALNKDGGYSDASDFLYKLESNETFKYIRHLDNYIKHINYVPLIMSVNADYSYEGIIKAFKHGGESFLEKDAFAEAKEILDFIQKTNSEFLRMLHNTTKCFRNRVSDVPFYLRKDKNGKLKFVAFFIDVESEILEAEKEFGSEIIEVKPMLYYQGRIYKDENFSCETIFIRKKGTKDKVIGKAERIEDGTQRVVYSVTSCTDAEYVQYRNDFSLEKSKIRFNTGAHLGVEHREKK